jgi:hypothetical protein
MCAEVALKKNKQVQSVTTAGENVFAIALARRSFETMPRAEKKVVVEQCLQMGIDVIEVRAQATDTTRLMAMSVLRDYFTPIDIGKLIRDDILEKENAP